MRVVHVIAGLGVGGAEHYLRRLVLSARGEGDTQHLVISLTTIGEVGAMLLEAGVAVEALGMRSILGLPVALWRLRCRLLALQPDVVQGWMYHGDLLGGLAARYSRQGRVVWGVRASELVAGVPRTTLLARWLCARVSSRVPDVIVCAAEAGRRVHIARGYDASKMRVIPNGFVVNDESLTSSGRVAVRDELGVGPQAQVVGIVGRFNPIKGIDDFVRAAGLLLLRFPDVRFLMVGKGLDPSNATLTRWVAESGVQSRIFLVGERSDVPQCLAAMDVFVLSSRAEGFPNVVGEAMAVGVPCVVTDVGDAAVLVAHTGRVVPANDAAALAEGVASLLALSPTERSTLGSQARARIQAEYSLPDSCARYTSLYAELSNERMVTP